MRLNKSELNSLASNSATRFDKEGLLIFSDRQEGFLWRSSEVRVERWCKLRGNLLFYLKDRDPKSPVVGVLVLENCCPRIHNEERDPEGYVFDLDFKDSISERFITYTSAERLAWVASIEDASNEKLNLLIRQLREQIEAKTRCSSSRGMGNHIDLGMPLALEEHQQEEEVLPPPVEVVAAPFEGDLIQF